MSLDINLTGVEKTSNKKTTLTDDSDTFYPTQKAVKTAVDAKENTITAGTTAQYFRGDKTFQTLDKTAVGLSNVDNTSDANKPVSTATQTALNAKFNTPTGTTSQYLRGDGSLATFPSIPSIAGLEETVNKSTDVNTDQASNTKYPSVKAVFDWATNLLNNKVDKITGKGLSTEDYTTAEKSKLAGIQAGAEVNVNADWNATSGDAQILNKPTIPSVAGLVPETRTINGQALSSNVTLTASDVGALPLTARVQTLTSSATVTATNINDIVTITAQAVGLTLANPTGTFTEGQSLIFRIKDNGTARSIAYGANFRAIGVVAPTTTVANKTTYIGCIFNSTDNKFDIIGVCTEA